MFRFRTACTYLVSFVIQDEFGYTVWQMTMNGGRPLSFKILQHKLLIIWLMLTLNVVPHLLKCVILTGNCYSYADILYVLWLNWICICLYELSAQCVTRKTNRWIMATGALLYRIRQTCHSKIWSACKIDGPNEEPRTFATPKPLMHQHIRLIDLNLIIASVACEYH